MVGSWGGRLTGAHPLWGTARLRAEDPESTKTWLREALAKVGREAEPNLNFKACGMKAHAYSTLGLAESKRKEVGECLVEAETLVSGVPVEDWIKGDAWQDLFFAGSALAEVRKALNRLDGGGCISMVP